MALVLIITVLSLAVTMVDSASDITSCNAPPSNITCDQGPCSQPPCTMRCGLTTPYDTCRQNCDRNSCASLICNASDLCRQGCSGGNCESMTCDAKNCFQLCNGGNCSLMTCSENAKKATACEQLSTTAEMICERDTCTQNCDGGNCNMTCSSSVKHCTQSCNGGNCRYKCSAQDDCNLHCDGGSCTEIKPSTTKNSADVLQMKASLGFGLAFAVVSFM